MFSVIEALYFFGINISVHLIITQYNSIHSQKQRIKTNSLYIINSLYDIIIKPPILTTLLI